MMKEEKPKDLEEIDSMFKDRMSVESTPKTVDTNMHTSFVGKLYCMLEDPDIQHLMKWTPAGDSFTVSNPTEFAKVILPNYFKHNNFASFVRQLNMYGFHKVNDHSVAPELWEFRHPSFQRGNPESLQSIKRKQSKSVKAPSNNLTAQIPKASPNSVPPTPISALPTHDIVQLHATPLPLSSATAEKAGLDRVEVMSLRIIELEDKLQHMHECYNMLLSETLSCRMMQSKHHQLISNLTKLVHTAFGDGQAHPVHLGHELANLQHTISELAPPTDLMGDWKHLQGSK